MTEGLIKKTIKSPGLLFPTDSKNSLIQVAHGQIGGGEQTPQHGHVAVPGVLRSTQSPAGYGINGAQYGAVSGQIISQSMPRVSFGNSNSFIFLFFNSESKEWRKA